MTTARRVFAAPSTKVAGLVLFVVILLTITGGLLAPIGSSRSSSFILIRTA